MITNATKYLVDTTTAKIASKPSKENIIEKGPKKRGKGTKKNYYQQDIVQQEVMVEDLDDFVVLQSLHKK